MKRFTIREEADLKEFLATVLSVSKGKAKELIDTRTVFVNSQRVWIASHRLHRNDVVEVADPSAATARRNPKFDVLYEDDSLIAVNKPPGVVCDEDAHSVEVLLRQVRGIPELQAIHRLDQDTSGVFLLAKNRAAFERGKALWQRELVEKSYRVICLRPARFRSTEVRLPVDGKRAVSRVTLLKKAHGYSYFQVDALTGRKHQVRLHLGAIGHPIVGDKQYGPRVIADPILKGVARQMLHCARIVLPAMAGGRQLQITAPLPGDFRHLARRLGLL
jgi:RluA family pseudouridine synthase